MTAFTHTDPLNTTLTSADCRRASRKFLSADEINARFAVWLACRFEEDHTPAEIFGVTPRQVRNWRNQVSSPKASTLVSAIQTDPAAAPYLTGDADAL